MEEILKFGEFSSMLNKSAQSSSVNVDDENNVPMTEDKIKTTSTKDDSKIETNDRTEDIKTTQD